MRLLLILMSLLLLNACVKVQENNTTVNKRFDLPSFFQQEQKRLEDLRGLKLQKTIIQNEKKESQVLQIEDWSKELALFSKYNIHQAQVYEEYTETKEDLGGGKYCLTYRTKNPKLGLKQADLYFNAADSIESIRLEQKIDNQVYDSSYELKYQPKIGYHLKKLQKVVLFDVNSFEIDAIFLNE